MTITEKNAEWIKQQRKRMMTAVSELAGILAAANFDLVSSPKYLIEFELGMSGNCIEIRVYDDNDVVEKIDYWNMNCILDDPFGALNKGYIEEKVTAFLREIARMKLCAEKYIKLNQQKQESRQSKC